MKTSATSENAEAVIQALLEKVRKRYITDSFVLPHILCGFETSEEKLQITDLLYQSVLTSIQFGQPRRAILYLQAFLIACKKTFGNDSVDTVIQALRSRIRL